MPPQKVLAPQLWQPDLYPDAHITSLGTDGDEEARRLLRRALRDAWPAARKFGWQVGAICELDPADKDVGYTGKDGTLFVKVRDPAKGRDRSFYSYSYVLATLLHELTHLSFLGHGRSFYRRFADAVQECRAEPALRLQVRAHICAELLNAVCDNDARRARGVLAVLPEAVACPMLGVGNQLPLEYAAHHGRVALTKLLLEARANADATCRKGGMPPLALAAARGNCKTAKLLLDAGATRGRAALDGLDSAIFAADPPATAGSQEPPSGGEPRSGSISSSAAASEASGSGGLAKRPPPRARRKQQEAPQRSASLPALPRSPDAASVAAAASGAAPSPSSSVGPARVVAKPACAPSP